MSLNGSSSYAYNYSNDYYHHMNRPPEENLKHKSKYQTRRLFEIEKQAVICLIIAILLFSLIYSIMMKRRMNNIKLNKSSEENEDPVPAIAKPNPISSMNSPLSQSYVPFQPNSQPRPIPPMLGGNSIGSMNSNINSNLSHSPSLNMPSPALPPIGNGLGSSMNTPMIV